MLKTFIVPPLDGDKVLTIWSGYTIIQIQYLKEKDCCREF